MIRLCIVEDDVSLRGKLVRLFADTPDICVTGAFVSAEECVEKILWEQTDVLLSDIEFPGMSGVDLITLACLKKPDLRAMAFTVYEDRKTVFAALRAGALGYVVKGAPIEEVAQAIRQMMEGGSPMSPAVARQLIGEFRNLTSSSNHEPLTSREKHLIRFIADGLLYKEIAAQLGLSVHTIHTHITNIYKKLHAGSRAEALHRAASLGYLG